MLTRLVRPRDWRISKGRGGIDGGWVTARGVTNDEADIGGLGAFGGVQAGDWVKDMEDVFGDDVTIE